MSLPPLNHQGHFQAYAHPQQVHPAHQQHQHQHQHHPPHHPQHHQLGNVGVHPASVQHLVHPQHYQHPQHQQQQQHHVTQYQHQHPQHQQHHPHPVPSPAPSASTPTPQQQQQQGTVAPRDTTYSPQPSTSTIGTPTHVHASINGSGTSGNVNGGAVQSHAQPQSGVHSPLVAQGDWTKNLVHLAKTAELKKHALTLQLHTAHILSAHATLETKNKALQDIKEQRNRLESERTRLLNCLREVNEDRDKTDLLETTINRECTDLRAKIQSISDGEFNAAKREVDTLRAELGQQPTPSLQQLIEDKSATYLNERRLAESQGQTHIQSQGNAQSQAQALTPATGGSKRTYAESASVSTPNTPGASTSAAGAGAADNGSSSKRPRGRPKGSKNKTKGRE